ncbi:MAG: asparagine synthase-related protein, partial [Pseudanabaena sp.]
HLAVATELNSDRYTLWHKNLPTKDLIYQTYYPHKSLQEMDRVTTFDLNCYLPGDILVKVDRATMAHSLESRSPFLDVDLVEFVLNLPWSLRFQESNHKYLLRQSCGKLWPYQIYKRPKQGFGAPIWNWIKRPDVQSLLQKVTDLNSPLSHLLPGLRGNANKLAPQQQWTILCLGLWIDKRSACINTLP